MKTSKAGTVITYVVLIVAALIIFLPMLFALSLSFVPTSDIMKGIYVPTQLYVDNYVHAFTSQPFGLFIRNSVISGVLSTFFQIAFSLLAAYALVFMRFRARSAIFALIMATMMIPGEVLIISNFQTIRSLGMLNTFQGLVIPGMASTFGIFLFRQNMLQIPTELQEAAEVAGLTDFQFFRKVVVPMVRNTVVTLAIYFFLVNWNAYLWPLLSTTDNSVRTIQIGLRQLNNVDGSSDLGMMAAGAVIASVPTLLLIFFGQRQLQEGMTKGALK